MVYVRWDESFSNYNYEVPVTICILTIILLAGSLSFKDLINGQGGHPGLGICFTILLLYIIFYLLCFCLAETNKLPLICQKPNQSWFQVITQNTLV